MQLLSTDPLILTIDDFLTDDEKEELVVGLETIINSFNKDTIISD